MAPKAQKKVPIPEGLDLEAWINEPPEESSESSDDEINVNSNNNVFGISSGGDSNHATPTKKPYVEPTKEDLEKSRQARIALQNSDPFYLKGSVKSPSRNLNNVNDIPVQKIDLEVPLQTVPGKKLCNSGASAKRKLQCAKVRTQSLHTYVVTYF